MQTTFVPTPADIRRQFFLVDATDVVLGRLCTELARRLSGKSKPQYTPHADVGDHVIVVNAARVKLTGRKLDRNGGKVYRRHTGYPGGLKEESAANLKARAPERLVVEGVKGMLPKTKLGRAMVKKLRVYAGPDHPHQAQQPVALDLRGRRASQGGEAA